MNLNKRLTTIITFTLFLIGFVFSRGPEQITQELQVEQAIHTKVEVTLAKLLNPSEYVIIVNATMSEKPLSLNSNSDSESNATTSFIPGMPTIPQNISSPTNDGIINYSTDKFLLYYLEIAIYLDEGKATGKMTQDIIRLIKEAIPDIADCDDCIRIETMKLGESSTTSDYNNLLERIEELEEERREAEEQISNWKFDQLQQQLAEYEDAINELENKEENRERRREIEDSIRLDNLIKTEKTYRRKQDSLILVTATKLDEAISGRIDSESNITQQLLDIIKTGIDDSSSSVLPVKDTPTQKDNSNVPQNINDTNTEDNQFNSPLILYIVLGLMFAILIVMLLLILRKNNQPVYLKPVNNNSDGGNSEQKSQQQTGAHENDDVIRSELNSLRQSAVSMSVGQKEGATQIVKDWLDSEEDNSNENNESEEK